MIQQKRYEKKVQNKIRKLQGILRLKKLQELQKIKIENIFRELNLQHTKLEIRKSELYLRIDKQLKLQSYIRQKLQIWEIEYHILQIIEYQVFQKEYQNILNILYNNQKKIIESKIKPSIIIELLRKLQLQEKIIEKTKDSRENS